MATSAALRPFAVMGADRVRLNLHAGQEEAWLSPARITFIIAGTQSGKTCFGPWWLLREIANCGDGDYLAVTATYDLCKLKMLPEMMRVFGATGWAWRASERVFEAGGARVILRSADAVGGLESATAKAAWLDECGQDRFRVSAWEAVLRRLSLHGGRVLGTTTPYNLGWLMTEIFDRWRAGDTHYRVIQFASIMNPAFPREEYERARATLPPWKFEMFYNGNFTRPAGLIYDCVDEANYCDPMPLPPHWPRYVGVDFGAVHNARVIIAVDPASGVGYVCDEALEGGLTSAEHAARALEALSGVNYAGGVGGSKGESQQRADWAAAGCHLSAPSVADVEAGIERVYGALKARRLRVFRTCTHIRDEIGGYSRELDERGQPTERIRNKEDYHLADALRYAVDAWLGSATGAVDVPEWA